MTVKTINKSIKKKLNKIFNPTNIYDKSVDNPESRFLLNFNEKINVVVVIIGNLLKSFFYL